MYQALLTRRYLTSKIMPYLAMLSVALCCTLTLLVWSIMGGFLDVFKDIGRKMEGDVSITWQTVGFGHYDDLIARLEKDAMVAAAAPVIRAYGMVSLPDDRAFAATIQGVDARYAKVAAYDESIWWRPLATAAAKDVNKLDPRLDAEWPAHMDRVFRNPGMQDGQVIEALPHGSFRSWDQLLTDGRALKVTDPRTGERRDAAVLGIEMGGFSIRQPGGWYKVPDLAASRRPDGHNVWSSGFLPARSVTITVLPMDKTGRDIATRSMKLPVANEFRTGFFETDKNTMLVPLGVLQKLLKMEQGEVLATGGGGAGGGTVNPYEIHEENGVEVGATPKAVRVEPAKVTTVLVKGKPGVDAEALRSRCEAVYEQFALDHNGQVPTIAQMRQARGISTWERTFALFIGQVQKETVTILLMLLVISLVCTVLILAIFWAMVSEKTKDVGILRAVGCSRTGVAWIWLRYGAVIGIVGAAVGLAGGCMLVWNINPIHDWLGRAWGVSVWDPSVYYLPEIPNKVKPDKATVVVVSAIILSLLGALIPALRAANMDPVKALRFE